MKNFLLLAGLTLLMGVNAHAQSRMTASADTNTNAMTSTHIATLSGDAMTYDVLTIQVVGTKVSGTVAGTAVLYGSVDGVNYQAIGTDTLTLANTATNSYIWTLDKTRYKYYRVSVATTGTQVSAWKAWILGRRAPK
jgi:hypothetical protein